MELNRSKLLRGLLALLLFVGVAEWLLYLMPKPHGPLSYMVAGTASTVAALAMLFARLVRRRELWSSSRRG